MVCNNFHIDHSPEDCFLDQSISDCSIDMADLLSFSDYKNVDEYAVSQEDGTAKEAPASPSGTQKANSSCASSSNENPDK